MGKPGRKIKKPIVEESDDSQPSFLNSEFDNDEIVKELRYEIRDSFPDIKVSIRLSRRRTGPDNIIFLFPDGMPASSIIDEMRRIAKPYQALNYKKTKSYAQWEANFYTVFKTREDDVTESHELL